MFGFIQKELEKMVTFGFIKRRKLKKKVMFGASSPADSDDLVIEILKRLPAEQLWWSCRRVCKRWNALISSPYFRQLHLQQQQQRPSPSSLFVFSRPFVPAQNTELLNFYYPRDDDDDDSNASYFRRRASGTSLLESWKHQMAGQKCDVIASCNGLLLFQCWNWYWYHKCNSPHNFYIGNPITGEFKPIMNIPRGVLLCGFFYYSPTQRYKVLLRSGISGFGILTLGSTEWESFSLLPCTTAPYFLPSVIVNNALYCIVEYNIHTQTKSELRILMFSIDTTSFRIIFLPPQARQFSPSMHILEIEGRLTCWQSKGLVFHIWAFQDDNRIQGNWTQIYNVDLYPFFRSYNFSPKDHISRIVSIQTGELLLLCPTKGVFRYNLSTATGGKIEFEGITTNMLFGDEISLHLIRYTKSLASLNNF